MSNPAFNGCMCSCHVSGAIHVYPCCTPQSVLAGVSTDELGRTPISDAIKASINQSLKAIPDGKRGALLVVATETGASAHVAARIGDHWKVAAGAGRPWDGPITGTVAIEGSW